MFGLRRISCQDVGRAIARVMPDMMGFGINYFLALDTVPSVYAHFRNIGRERAFAGERPKPDYSAPVVTEQDNMVHMITAYLLLNQLLQLWRNPTSRCDKSIRWLVAAGLPAFATWITQLGAKQYAVHQGLSACQYIGACAEPFPGAMEPALQGFFLITLSNTTLAIRLMVMPCVRDFVNDLRTGLGNNRAVAEDEGNIVNAPQ